MGSLENQSQQEGALRYCRSKKNGGRKAQSRLSLVKILNGRRGVELGRALAKEVSENGRPGSRGWPEEKLIGIQSKSEKKICGLLASEDFISDIERWAERPRP